MTENQNISVWKFVWKYVSKAKFLALSLVLMFVLTMVLRRSQDYVMSQMIGVLGAASQYPNLAQMLISWLIAFAVAGLCISAGDGYRRVLEARFVPYFTGIAAKDMFAMVHKHAMRYFEEEMAGNIAGKVRNILNNLEHFCGTVLFGILQPLISIFVSLGFILVMNVWLGLILGGINLFFMGLTIWFRRQITPFAVVRYKTLSAMSGVFVDGVTNSSLVKSFANYFYEKHFYFNAVRAASHARREQMMKDAFINWASKSIFDVMMIISYALIFYFWYIQELTLANVVLATLLIGSFVDGIKNIGFFASSFAEFYGGIQDGLNLLCKPYEVLDKPNAKNLKIRHNDVCFENVKFRYKPDKPLFEKFQLDIRPCEKVGLVGYSGSGKSTLVKLLLRYYDIQGGQILIDGQNIADVRQESLRRHIAFIPQESTLFNRSIMENIRYGNPKATDKQVIAAAKKAYIHNFIMTLPDQYNSKVGERGVMLSGGERQRIAIARAILKDAPILILDEATSALDSESEQYIQKSLQTLMKNKTVIAIAHRLSTLKAMDRLIVLRKGKIAEQGTSDFLLQKGGIYKKFYDMQSQGFIGHL